MTVFLSGKAGSNMRKILLLSASLIFLLFVNSAMAADVVPTEIELPGTQPNEVGNFESPNKCDNCHAGYNINDPEAEPATGWRGSAMGNAGRDPIFWATLAIAEQVFDGSGDLCIRCHSTGGWIAGRSTPTDGSGLQSGDSDGVDCDSCHKMTNPDNSEHIGEMNAPYIANKSGEGFYGSGMLSAWGSAQKLGPYSDAEARHQWMRSQFHSSTDFCGSCHDVSNSAVGDLAPNHGTQPGAPSIISSYDFPPVGSPNLGGPVTEKAAFNNPPYAYGVVERTFSEYKSGLLSQTLVSDFASLPADLQVAGGSIEVSYQAALLAGTDGNYEDYTPRYFSCQTCHMRPTTGVGCNKNGTPFRNDLPRHDMTGGNYWLADIIMYQDARGHLRLGGGLTQTQTDAIYAGQQRAKDHLNQSAHLDFIGDGNTLKVTNLTGHKLITGYPEGRRMWLNIKWYDSLDVLLREDGAYGPLLDENGDPVTVTNPANAQEVQVESILDLDDPNARIYEAHYAMTKEWADVLLSVDYAPGLVLSYDRYTGATDYTLGELGGQAPGTYHETFHFVLNNHVAKDIRIPPYGFSGTEAKKRNALPVPADQYGGNGEGTTYNHWDEVSMDYPPGAAYAEIDLLYQGTSWEYVQFLYLANNGASAFLADEGVNMLEAWLNTGMVAPYVMESITWVNSGCPFPKTRIPGTPPLYRNTLQAAYYAAADGKTVQSQAVSFNGDISINQDKSVTFEGGYDCNYTGNTGTTTINGNMMISDGTLTILSGIFEVL